MLTGGKNGPPDGASPVGPDLNEGLKRLSEIEDAFRRAAEPWKSALEQAADPLRAVIEQVRGPAQAFVETTSPFLKGMKEYIDRNRTMVEAMSRPSPPFDSRLFAPTLDTTKTDARQARSTADQALTLAREALEVSLSVFCRFVQHEWRVGIATGQYDGQDYEALERLFDQEVSVFPEGHSARDGLDLQREKLLRQIFGGDPPPKRPTLKSV